MKAHAVSAIAVSAACGADLLALKAARDLDLRFRIVLPFEPELFRKTSVIDRPGEWGELFDDLIAKARSRRDLVVLGLAMGVDESYRRTNHVILQEAIAMAKSAQNCGALVIWNGEGYGSADMTREFKSEAEHLGLTITEILTL